jgi:hypothetical protein
MWPVERVQKAYLAIVRASIVSKFLIRAFPMLAARVSGKSVRNRFLLLLDHIRRGERIVKSNNLTMGAKLATRTNDSIGHRCKIALEAALLSLVAANTVGRRGVWHGN